MIFSSTPPDVLEGPQTSFAWQKIESAPRDGTRILLGGFRAGVPDYYDLKAQAPLIGTYFSTADGPAAPVYWFKVSGGMYAPTHWAPLPPPPSDVRSGS